MGRRRGGGSWGKAPPGQIPLATPRIPAPPPDTRYAIAGAASGTQLEEQSELTGIATWRSVRVRMDAGVQGRGIIGHLCAEAADDHGDSFLHPHAPLLEVE